MNHFLKVALIKKLISGAKKLAPYVGTSIAVGAGDAVGSTIARKLTGQKSEQSMLSEGLTTAKWTLPFALAFGMKLGKSPQAVKSLWQRMKGTKDPTLISRAITSLKNTKLTSGADPLLSLKKGRQWHKPAVGAVAGGAINYDEANPITSTAKGALTGAAVMSPMMFKDKMDHSKFQHVAFNDVLDSGAIMLGMGGISNVFKRKQENQRKKLMLQQRQQQTNKMW